jgi:hypothetical protein
LTPDDPAPPFARWSDSLEYICRNAAEIRTSITPLYSRLDPDLLETLLTEEVQGQRMMEMHRILAQIIQMNPTHLGELHHSMDRWLASLEKLQQLRSTTIRSSQITSTP